MTYREKMFLEKVGKRLKDKRNEAGYTQMQVYVRTSITPNSVSNYEAGARSMDLVRLHKLADCYGCKVSDFVEGVV